MVIKTKFPGYVNIAVISDIHLNHPRTKTGEVVEKLIKTFPISQETAKLDMIVIAGDLFDSIMMYSEDNAFLSNTFIRHLLKVCAMFDIKLRVLEGTPSHDRVQSRYFEEFYTAMGLTFDFRYVDILEIERINDFGMDVLYIPDEWHSDPAVIWEQVQDTLRTNGLTHVDFAIMHGMFDYQVPNGMKLPCLNSEDYMSIVKHFIAIGHIHTSSRYGKIIAQGSFDRLRQNEEEAKGHYRIRVNLSNPELSEADFIVNPWAKIYLTYDFTAKEVEEVMTPEFHEAMSTYPDDSYIRFHRTDANDMIALVESLKQSFPNLNISSVKKESKAVASTTNEIRVSKVVPINSRSVHDLLEPRLAALSLDVTQRASVLELLDIVINEQDTKRTG